MSEFTEEILWQFNELDDEGPNYQDIIRVVQYGKGSPLLEKRNYYFKNDEWRMGKARGFTADDFASLLVHGDKIEKILSKEKKKKTKKKPTKKTEKNPKKKTGKKPTKKKSTKEL